MKSAAWQLEEVLANALITAHATRIMHHEAVLTIKLLRKERQAEAPLTPRQDRIQHLAMMCRLRRSFDLKRISQCKPGQIVMYAGEFFSILQPIYGIYPRDMVRLSPPQAGNLVWGEEKHVKVVADNITEWMEKCSQR